ncbi:MAG: hydroxymethylpyrimidine/phosphomethylpyrimidine kinase [Acidobacteriaceae bacterium]|nr:hydroxymethylpyrimidine/phosphomethylpyrimidine kinase [Acidobacteriaceae bacterium]
MWYTILKKVLDIRRPFSRVFALMPTASKAASPPVLLSIAGFDPSSGAGITADLAVFGAHHCFGTSAISVMTVQSTRGVAGVEESCPDLLGRTLAHLTEDLPPDGIKIGALGSQKLAEKVFFLLGAFPSIPVVFDPVLLSSSGKPLFALEDIPALKSGLLNRVSWITPNWAELALLSGRPVGNREEAELAADELAALFPKLNIVATGGDQKHPADLVRLFDGEKQWLEGEHIDSTSTHGTGCAFSSSLLANLVLGQEPFTAASNAKAFVTEAIRCAPRIGHGRGPLDLLWPLRQGSSA